jgi:beta-glucosidase
MLTGQGHEYAREYRFFWNRSFFFWRERDKRCVSPGSIPTNDPLTAVSNNGSLSTDRVDDMIHRIMTPYFLLHQDIGFPAIDGYSPKLGLYQPPEFEHNFTLGPVEDVRKEEHRKLICKLGAEGTVMLKNSHATLPLVRPMSIGVFGNDAADVTDGHYSLVIGSDGQFKGNYNIGTLPVGGGSGTGRFTYIVSPLDAIMTRAQSYGALVQYVTNNDVIASGGLSLAPIPLEVCVVFLKSWASEGEDRATLVAGWNSTVVVKQVAAMCPNTIVVLHGAAPNVMPWANNPNITAILAAHLPGQETGNAIVDILWGDVNPSGRLPYTIAYDEADYARNIVNSTVLHQTTDPDAWSADFEEKGDIDYRYFDSKNMSVAYEFGYGLSYTTFELSDLLTEKLVRDATTVPSPDAEILPGGNVELWESLAAVNATVINTGSVFGSTVVQLYLSYPEEAHAPLRSLRGFEKVPLRAGASRNIRFLLTRRDLSYWSPVAQTWRLPKGDIRVHVGFSSRDLPLLGKISM